MGLSGYFSVSVSYTVLLLWPCSVVCGFIFLFFSSALLWFFKVFVVPHNIGLSLLCLWRMPLLFWWECWWIWRWHLNSIISSDSGTEDVFPFVYVFFDFFQKFCSFHCRERWIVFHCTWLTPFSGLELLARAGYPATGQVCQPSLCVAASPSGMRAEVM